MMMMMMMMNTQELPLSTAVIHSNVNTVGD